MVTDRRLSTRDPLDTRAIVVAIIAAALALLLYPFSLIAIGPLFVIGGIITLRRNGPGSTRGLAIASIVIGAIVILFLGYVLATTVGIQTRRGVDIGEPERPIERRPIETPSTP